MTTSRVTALIGVPPSFLPPKVWEPLRLKNVVEERDERSINGSETLFALTKSRGLVPRSEVGQRASEASSYEGYKRFFPDDIVMNKMQAWNGLFGLAKDEGIVSPEYTILQCSERVLPAYLTYLLRTTLYSGQFGVVARGMGTAFLRVHTEDLGGVGVSLPPIEEQRAIVWFLDEQTAKIDALIDKKNRLQVLLLEEARAYLTSMLWPDPLPDGWSMTPLMRLTQPSRPIMYGIVLPGPNVPEGVPLVKGGDVSNNRMHPNLLNKTTLEIEAPYARARLSGGDVLLTIRGRYGDAALVPDVMSGANITQDIARIAPRPEIDSKWLLRVLQSQPIVRKMFNEALGAAVQGVNIRDVKRYQVPLPPPAEQGRLASEIDDRLTTIEEAANSLAQATARLREYRSALITAAVTGQIDVGSAA